MKKNLLLVQTVFKQTLFKQTLFAMIIVSLLLVSCKSQTAKVTDNCFDEVYKRYKSDLILVNSKKHIVKKGDVLVDIAKEYYNNGFYYPIIMLASSEIVLDPDKISPGMVLTIPDIEINRNDENARISIKGVILDCAVLEDRRNRLDTAQGLRMHAQTF